MLDQQWRDLVTAVEASDPVACEDAMRRLWTAAQELDRDELTRLVGSLTDLTAGLPSRISALVAIMAGAFVENGAEPDALAAPVADGLGRSLDVAAAFVDAWRSAVDADGELPEPVNDQDARDRATAALAGKLPPDEAASLVDGWFSAGLWVLPANTVLQFAQVRRAVDITSLRGAVARISALRTDLGFVTGLLNVLDGEQLVVLHRPSGRGFEVTISGVGDNFQLHTLLADALIGDPGAGLLEGTAPDPQWVAAATHGPIEPPNGPIRGQFNLVDAAGEWIWNEGRPADIPELDGRRVVVLDPPPYERSWNTAREYPRMRPDVRVHRILPSDEAAAWLSRVAPPSDG